jgi:hypothetical protein
MNAPSRITNKYGLPAPLVEAVRNDSYSAGDTLSVTTLIKPPQAWALERQHADEITEDASERIWSLLGQSVHVILERAGVSLGDDYVLEQRFHAKLDGVDVSGQADVLQKSAKLIADYKVTSAYAIKGAISEGKAEWQLQLSMLASLARHNGYEIERGQIVAIAKDWARRTAEEEARKAASFGAPCSYPQAPVIVLDIPLLSNDATIDWMRNRIKQFMAAKEGNPPPCTDEERWKQQGRVAVMKQGRKTALKLFDTRADAERAIGALGGTHIEERPTKYNRCEGYCSAAPFCRQHQETMNELR